MSFLVDFLVWGTRLSKITHRGEPLEWHMTSLVERLRDVTIHADPDKAMAEGADRIEALEMALRNLLDAEAMQLNVADAFNRARRVLEGKDG